MYVNSYAISWAEMQTMLPARARGQRARGWRRVQASGGARWRAGTAPVRAQYGATYQAHRAGAIASSRLVFADR